jgi:uncharacterized membrane protein YeiH
MAYYSFAGEMEGRTSPRYAAVIPSDRHQLSLIAQRALAVGLNPVMAALLGMLTGIGGGMTCDLLLTKSPAVLRADLYAIAALAGAAMVVIGTALRLPSTAVTIAGASLCFGLRLIAIHRGGHLPVASAPE